MSLDVNTQTSWACPMPDCTGVVIARGAHVLGADKEGEKSNWAVVEARCNKCNHVDPDRAFVEEQLDTRRWDDGDRVSDDEDEEDDEPR